MLEQALKDFEGTIIFVSHDRYFINQLANKVFDLNINGGQMFWEIISIILRKLKKLQLSKHMKQ